MAYVLVLLALLGTFVWASPARSDMHASLGDSARALIAVAQDAATPLAGYGSQLLGKVRAKAMEFIRQELHKAIDDKVQ